MSGDGVERALENERFRLTVVPGEGASISGFALRRQGRWIPILRPTPADALAPPDASRLSSFVLAPWSNRIGGARFAFAGTEHRLRPNTADGHAIHGDVRHRAFETVDSGPSSLALQLDSRRFADFNFPFPMICGVRHTLHDDGLELDLAVENVGEEAMPAGLGIHPYFPRSPSDLEETPEIQLSATGVYRGLVPTRGPVPIPPDLDLSIGRRIDGLDLDHCYAGWNGQARITWPLSRIRVQIAADPLFSHAVVYVPPGKPHFAVEPVSNANNGFQLLADGIPDNGVRVLAPGERLRGAIRLRVSET